MEYKDESDMLLLSRSLQSSEGVEKGTWELGHEGGGRLRQENIVIMAILGHLLCARLCTNHFIDIVVLSTTLKEMCDLYFTGEETKLRLRKVILTKGISNSGPLSLFARN